MVLMNLFAGQEWEMQTQRTDLGHREGRTSGRASGTCTPPGVKQPATGVCCVMLGAQGELRDTRKGGRREAQDGGHTRTYGRSTLLRGRRQHSVVKGLSSN